jgi:hypothetical protein
MSRYRYGYGYYRGRYPYRHWYYGKRWERKYPVKRERVKRKKEHPLAEGFYYIAERISERLSSDSGMGR